MIVMICAMALNRVIGINNTIPWHIPSDLKHFKRVTTGSTMIMGRKTFESFGSKPLPNRMHVVLTSNPMFDPKHGDSVFYAANKESALAISTKITTGNIYIIGGETIYKQLLDVADEIILTEIQQEFDGDTFFPALPFWEAIDEETHLSESIPYIIRRYRREQ